MNIEDGSFGRGWPLMLLATMACEREERWRVRRRSEEINARFVTDIITNTKTAQSSRQLTQGVVQRSYYNRGTMAIIGRCRGGPLQLAIAIGVIFVCCRWGISVGQTVRPKNTCTYVRTTRCFNRERRTRIVGVWLPCRSSQHLPVHGRYM